MRTASQRLVLCVTLLLPLGVQAGPETTGVGIDLRLLDLNGAPFRSFHLGYYSQGLNAQQPTAATPLPSKALRDEGEVWDLSPTHIGLDAARVGALPDQPDITPLLRDRMDERLLVPATN